MKQVVAEVNGGYQRDNLAEEISRLWDNHQQNRRSWLDQKKELRNYIFATDTTTTSNSTLPWKNKTTLPKLTQIRDNLHANYQSALFPNDDWMKWEGYSKDGATKEKRKAIEGYMSNKVREGNFRTEISKLLYDYIDYGNCFYDTVWVNQSTKDSLTGEDIPGFIGPQLVRISPNDIVFNPLADFDNSYKICRYVKTLGEMKTELDSRPELGYNRQVVEDAYTFRARLGGMTTEDLDKLAAFQVDGFGSFSDYLQTNYVEILEFEGDMYDTYSGELLSKHIITVMDRSYVIRKEQMPSWLGKSTKGHVGWRLRPDNAYAMGPLDNLVGMQYRIDHLENLKADAMDLAVHPPLVIAGNVEEFNWGPGCEINVGEGGAITELGKNLNGVISASNEIDILERKMEEMAGAPKQAMGIRTPGEKTAFEVQTLEMAASRIFQNKITNFEINLVEPALNRMLELSRRNMDGADIARVMDDDFGVVEFLSITKADITSSGKLRPIGARHFASNATKMQNLVGIANTPLWQDPTVKVHFSGKAIAKMIEEMLGLEKFELIQDNAAIFEQLETQQLTQQAMEEIAVTNQTPVEPEEEGAAVVTGTT